MSDSPHRQEVFWRTRRWWKQVLGTSAGVWAATALSIVASIMAARGLGPRSYGSVLLAVATVGLITTFLDLPLEEAVIFHGSQAIEDRDFGRLRSLLGVALRLDFLIGAVVTLLVLLAAESIANLVSRTDYDPMFIRVAAIGALARTLDGTTGAMLILGGRPTLRGWALAFTNLLRLGLVAVALWLGDAIHVLGAFAFSSLLGSISQGLLAWRFGWRSWRVDESIGQPHSWFRVLLPFGFHSALSSSVLAGRSSALSVILGRLAGREAVAYFNVGMLPMSIVGVATAGLRIVLLMEQSRLSARKRIHELRESIRKYSLTAFAIGLPGALLGWFLIPHLIPALYSNEYLPAVTPARVLIIAALVGLVIGWSKVFPAAVGRPQLRTAVVLAETVVALSLLLAFSRFGALGAALALTASVLVGAGIWWLMVHWVWRSHQPYRSR